MEVDMTLQPVSFDSCFDFCTTTDSDDDDEARLNKLLMPFMKLRFSVSLLSEGDFSSGFDSVIRMELLADVLLSLFSPASSESGESVGVEVDGCRLKKQSSPSARGGSRLSGACRHGRVGACVFGRLGRAFPRCSSFSDVGDKFGRLSVSEPFGKRSGMSSAAIPSTLSTTDCGLSFLQLMLFRFIGSLGVARGESELSLTLS